MSTVSVQLIVESIRSLLGGDKDITLGALSIAFVCTALAVKLVLLLYCWGLRDYPSVGVLVADHRNDLLVNSVGLAGALVAAKAHVPWLDPATAILVALIILRSWTATAFEQARLIVGKSADAGFLRLLTYIAVTHHRKVLKIDTCRAYHAGHRMFVEVDVVMDPSTPLNESHDISELLQMKLELLPEVERAFVHVDYETSHKPEHLVRLDLNNPDMLDV